LDINPTDLSTIEQLGNIYMNLHQFDKATAMFQREVDQGDISSVINGYQNMSKAYQAAGDMNNANICMQKAQDAYNAYQAANPEPAK
jgi:tetratricopeptide (TPR) repeat protein